MTLVCLPGWSFIVVWESWVRQGSRLLIQKDKKLKVPKKDAEGGRYTTPYGIPMSFLNDDAIKFPYMRSRRALIGPGMTRKGTRSVTEFQKALSSRRWPQSIEPSKVWSTTAAMVSKSLHYQCLEMLQLIKASGYTEAVQVEEQVTGKRL